MLRNYDNLLSSLLVRILRETEPISYTSIYLSLIYLIYYRGKLPWLWSQKKSHDLLSSRSEPQKLMLIQSKARCLRTRVADGISVNSNAGELEGWWYKPWFDSEGLRTRNTDIWRRSCTAQAEIANSPFLILYILFQIPQWIGWCPPALVRIILLSQLIQMLISYGNSL